MHDAELCDAAPPRTQEGPRRAYRTLDRAWLGGVCAGLAKHLQWPVLALRLMFVLLMIVGVGGLVLYGALWLLLPLEKRTEAPGLEAATRQGKRTARKQRRRRDWHRVVPLSLLGFGLLGLVQTLGIGLSSGVFWPLMFATAGVALVWYTADVHAERADAGTLAADGRWYAPFVGGGRVVSMVRIVLGMALVGTAVGLVFVEKGQLYFLPSVLMMAALLVGGIGLVAAPWIHGSVMELRQAREDKVRADERADMAAHLHDSVLQTLALIQRQADDPKAVATLARRQERELRTWLYGDVIREESLKAALDAAAAEVDDEWGTPVEVVCVGDTPLNDNVVALIRAAREAMVNAAKHAGADRIDVFAEVGDEVEVFIRDRGIGFDVDAIADDRQGLRGSIFDRMDRHGGRAEIRSAPGEGTEVRLFLPLTTTEPTMTATKENHV